MSEGYWREGAKLLSIFELPAAMAKKSAGILMYRFRNASPELLLAHPGGPFWARKDEGAWSIPKGEFIDEEPLEAAKREFFEETGHRPSGNFITLQTVRQNSAKTIYPFAVEGDLDEATIESNLYEMEWPAGSGKMMSYPEVDRVAWFTPRVAEIKILKGQRPIIEELMQILSGKRR